MKPLIVLGLLLCLAPAAEAATRTWDGGGADNNWNTAANWSSNQIPGSSDTAEFDNTSTKNCTINVDINVQGIDILSGYTGTITQSAGRTVTVGSGDFLQEAGTFIGGNSTFDCNDNFRIDGGSFTAPTATFFLDGNFTFNGGTFVHNSGTLALDGGAATLDIGSAVLNHLTVEKGSSNLTVTGTSAVDGSLTITSVGSINTGTISVKGNVVPVDTAVGGSGTILLTGTNNQTLGPSSGTAQVPRVAIDKTGGTLTLQNTIGVTGNFTYTAGTVAAGTSTVQFATNALTVNSGAMAFNDVDIAIGNNTFTVTGAMDVNGDLTITSASNINTGTIAVAGDVTVNDTSLGGTGTLKLDGTGTQTLSAVANGDVPITNIDKAAGTAQLGSDLIFVSTLTITNGTLDQGASFNLRVNGATTIAAGGILFNNGTGDLTLGGNVANSGTVSFDSGGGGSSVDDILIRSTSGTARTWSGSGTFTFLDVDVARMTAGATPGVINALSSTDSGNNTNWNFGNTAAVLHLKLDDGGGTTADDSSGNNFDGTLTGGPVWSSTDHAPLPVSNPYSVSFDGVDDSIVVSSAALLNPGLAFTISGWVKPTSVSSGVILGKFNTTGNQRQYKLELSAGKLLFSVSTNGQSSGVRTVTSTGSISAGAWTHVAAVYAGNAMSVYINGTKTQASVSLASAFTTGTDSLQLGRDAQGSFYTGLIDEVKLYNISLSDAEIAALAQQDTTPPGQPLNLGLVGSSDGTEITGTVTSPSDSDVSQLIWRYIAVDGNTTPTFPSTSTSGLPFGDGITTSVSPSTVYQKLATGLASLKTYGVAVWAKDQAGNVSTVAAQASLFLSPPVPRLVITAGNGAAVAEAASNVVFTITAKDENNNVITAYAGPYSLTWTPLGGSAVTLVNNSSSGWSNGVVTASVSIGGVNAGQGSFSAVDNSSSGLATGTLAYTWYPTSFTVAAESAALTSGKLFTLTATAKDLAGATVTRYKGTAALSLSYENPNTGTTNLARTSLLPADFSAGVAAIQTHYMDAGAVKITAKDTTFAAGKTITGTTSLVGFLPASFGVTIQALPPRQSKLYTDQPFNVSVKALAADGTTVTPNFNAAVTLGGSGVPMDTRTAAFLPAVDKGTKVFQQMRANGPGTMVLEARMGALVSGKANPMGVRRGLLVINPASSAPPGTIQTTAFILDADTGELVSDDDSTRFTLTLGTPTAGTAAVSPAAVNPVKMSSGVTPITISKADTGNVTVSASVVGFSMRVTPAVMKWVTGSNRTGTGLKVLQFEQRPGQRGRMAVPPAKLQPKAPPSIQKLEQPGAFRRGVNLESQGVPPVEAPPDFSDEELFKEEREAE